MSGKGSKKGEIEARYDLDLPDAPDFISEPPQYTWEEMVKLTEKMLPHWNKVRYSKPEPFYVGDAFTLDEE